MTPRIYKKNILSCTNYLFAGEYSKKMIVPETAKIFPAGQTVKARASACGGLGGKPRRLIWVAISETINLCTMLLKRLLQTPWGGRMPRASSSSASVQETTVRSRGDSFGLSGGKPRGPIPFPVFRIVDWNRQRIGSPICSNHPFSEGLLKAWPPVLSRRRASGCDLR